MRNSMEALMAAYLPYLADAPQVLRLRKKRRHDPRVALQFRVEGRIRKVLNRRKREGKPAEVSEDEIREWVKEEAAHLGLELKEAEDDGHA